MLIYRVEASYITVSHTESDWYEGQKVERYIWDDNPRSPYGWSGSLTNATAHWLVNHGIKARTFSHVNDMTIERLPTVRSDQKLKGALAEFHKVSCYQELKEYNPKFQKPFFFGFESPIAACNWFDADDRALLKEMGYYIAVYHVPDSNVCKGEKQLMFIRQNARQVDCIYFE